MSRSRSFVRAAESRSRAPACARAAGPSSRLSRRLTASGSASRSPSMVARDCCRWKQSPIRPRTIARAAVRYDEVARKLVHGLKYGDRLDLAPTMGAWMARAGCDLLADAEALVPVPLHWRRQWARRFNQSALLAHIVANASGRMVAHRALKRVKATTPQVGLDKSERAQNVQGAYRVPAAGRAEVAGRRLLLIDDVLTSGATVSACARTLLRAGATCVDVLVFARVVAGSRAPI